MNASRHVTPNGMRGFTLMELLVVLVITAMLMTMLFQSLQIFQRAQERIDVKTLQARQAELVDLWFENSVNALYPHPPVRNASEQAQFEGDATRWQGYTLQPLRGTPGAPVLVQWRVESDRRGSRLIYKSSDQLDLVFAQSARDLHFSYFDEAGKAYSQWPPSKGLHTSLPAAIALADGTESNASTYRYVAVRGPLQPLLEPFEIEED